MQKRTVIAAVAIAGALAAGGSAFTAGNTVANSTAGYGTSTVSGATATAISHTLSADGTTIVSSSITFGTDQTGKTVKAAFGAANLESCTVAVGGLSAACSWGTPYDTATATSFNVAVS